MVGYQQPKYNPGLEGDIINIITKSVKNDALSSNSFPDLSTIRPESCLGVGFPCNQECKKRCTLIHINSSTI